MDESEWAWPPLVGVPVRDVNGARLGRVVEVVGGSLRVEVPRGVAARLALGSGVLEVPLREIVEADDHDVTLREEGRFLAHPEERVTTVE